MAIDFQRQVGCSSARQGGYSVRVLPSPVPYQASIDGIVFRPRFTEGRWNLELSDPAQAELTVRDAEASTPAGTFSLMSGIAPGGGDALRATPYSWRWLESPQNVTFTPPESFTGVTLEMWVDFGPNGSFVPEEGKGASVITFLAPEPQGSTPAAPLAYLQAEVAVNQEFPDFAQIAMNAGLQRTGVFSDFYSRAVANNLVVGAASVDTAGWNHFAAEFTPEGASRVYFNGELMASASASVEPPPSFWSGLDLFCPAWVFFQNSTIGTGRPRTDVHFVRYTPSLLYNGASFTPPQLP